ncbi:unnamed protein product [Pleuronectes platessa]|uniref:Uncharacterized protein n=1 Tax=Pleuronectes platessa TaxID=8262 RepID=A0A9N7VL90_PLEPL|nr:unnamed protein product [Pleuronectes platessa]
MAETTEEKKRVVVVEEEEEGVAVKRKPCDDSEIFEALPPLVASLLVCWADNLLTPHRLIRHLASKTNCEMWAAVAQEVNQLLAKRVMLPTPPLVFSPSRQAVKAGNGVILSLVPSCLRASRCLFTESSEPESVVIPDSSQVWE